MRSTAEEKQREQIARSSLVASPSRRSSTIQADRSRKHHSVNTTCDVPGDSRQICQGFDVEITTYLTTTARSAPGGEIMSRASIKWWGHVPQRKAKKSLKKQPPEKGTGAFAPLHLCSFLRSGKAYSLPSADRQVLRRQASHVPFAGRPRPKTEMNEHDTTEQHGSLNARSDGSIIARYYLHTIVHPFCPPSEGGEGYPIPPFGGGRKGCIGIGGGALEG